MLLPPGILTLFKQPSLYISITSKHNRCDIDSNKFKLVIADVMFTSIADNWLTDFASHDSPLFAGSQWRDSPWLVMRNPSWTASGCFSLNKNMHVCFPRSVIHWTCLYISTFSTWILLWLGIEWKWNNNFILIVFPSPSLSFHVPFSLLFGIIFCFCHC